MDGGMRDKGEIRSLIRQGRGSKGLSSVKDFPLSRKRDVTKYVLKWIGGMSASFFISNIGNLFYHILNIVLVGSMIFNFPPSGTAVISSTMISLWARRSIILTHRSISREVTLRHPVVKRPDEVIDFVTLDLAPLTPGSGPVGVWRRI